MSIQSSQVHKSTDLTEPLVLVVDDDPDQLILLQRWLISSGYLVDGASNGRQALARIERERPDLVITDLVMDEIDGLGLVQQIQTQDPLLPIMIVSGQARIADALNAANLGVIAFLEKPVQREKLLAAVQDILGHLTAPGEQVVKFAPDFVHRSPLINDLLMRAHRVAGQSSPLLLLGPVGSGKELLAQAIHASGDRVDGPLVNVQCSLPPPLLEAELFGHGQKTLADAKSGQIGGLLQANHGTLFLEDVADLPLDIQAELLRVLQQRCIRPLNSDNEIAVDVRLIAASSHTLEDRVARGEFREDLFYRLNVVSLRIPSLAERREDIPALVEHFLANLNADAGGRRKRFSPDALRQLVKCDWPGNVRQLGNVVQQCHVLSTSPVIAVTLVEEAVSRQASRPPPLDEAKMGFERRYLASLLRTTAGNVTDAANLAGRNRTEFYKLLHRHKLDPADFRAQKHD